MLSQLADVIQTCINFFPHLSLLKPTHGAVKFKAGGEVEVLKPGLYLWWPLVTEVKELPIARQAIPLAPQTVWTKDGTSLAVCGVIVFTITGVREALVGNWDVDDTVTEVARFSIADVVAGLDAEALQKEIQEKTLQTKLIQHCEEELKEFGVKVQKCKLTEFSEKPLVVRNMGGRGEMTLLAEEEDE